MQSKIIILFVSVIIAVSSLPKESYSADAGYNNRAENKPAQKSADWNSQLTFGLLPSADINGSASAEITDYRFRLSHKIQLNGQLTLTAGANYGVKHINASSNANLPENLHNLALEAGLNYRINEKSYLTAKVFPGFYSDFKDIGSDDLRMPLLALGGYTFNNGVTLVGGFGYRFGYHSTSFIPIIGLSFQPDEHWRLDLMAPRPGITYIASRQLHLFAAGDFASDEYELKDHSLGAKVIRYSDYKVMCGADFMPTTNIKISGALGYAFDRSFNFYDGNRPSAKIDNVPFLKLSLDYGW